MSSRLSTGQDGFRIAACAGCVTMLAVLNGCASAPGGTRGAPWTILCVELSGPERARHIQQLADAIRNTPRINPDEVRVTNNTDGYARLYYGSYIRRTHPKTGRRSMSRQMRAGLDLVKQLGDDAGRRYFLQALPARMPTPDVGNPEWALGDVQAECSLQVAVFEPTDRFHEYKRAAAEFCKLLRDQGYEAYYHHTPACSMVTVGAFGPDAVITQPGGRTYYSTEVQALQHHELLKHNLLNGSVYKIRNDDGVAAPVYSQLVKIPRGPAEGSP